MQVCSGVLQALVFLKPRTRNGNFFNLEGLYEYQNPHSNPQIHAERVETALHTSADRIEDHGLPNLG